MRIRIELEDGTMITIERPGQGRLGIRSIATHPDEGAAPPGGEPAGETAWSIQPGGTGEVVESFDAGHAPRGEEGQGAEELVDPIRLRASMVGGQVGTGGETDDTGSEEEVIDAGPAPGAARRQEVVFTQRSETTPDAGKPKKQRKKSR